MQVQTSGLESTRLIEAQLLHQKIQDLPNRTKVWSHKDEKHISRLRKKGIEILSSQLDRQTVVVWIWCHLQTAIKHVQKLYETDQLRDVLFEEIQPFVLKLINIDRNQFKKIIVESPVSVDFTQRMEIGFERVYGMTKLHNLIYVLCGLVTFCAFRVYVKDRNTFIILWRITVDEFGSSEDIGSSENDNCLYILDCRKKCIWKFTIKIDGKHKIFKWLTIDYDPLTMSVSSDGQLLMANNTSSILMIYGSSAELVRSIQLPSDIENVRHAVKTSIGNFIIICTYRCAGKKKSRQRWPSGRKRETNSVIVEFTSDGQIIRNFIPSNETQKLSFPFYLSLDSDDRVFVADTGNERVILLDSDLKWNSILCPTNEEEGGIHIMPQRLCYDEVRKGVGHLFVGGYKDLEDGVDVYTLIIFK